VARFIRDALVMEDGDTLHLARGTDRQWLGSGQRLGAQGMATHFGRVSYEIRYDPQAGHVVGFIETLDAPIPRVTMHIRLPDGGGLDAASTPSGATLGGNGSTVEWRDLSGKVPFQLRVE
jgi:hypothetical protein